MNIHSVVIGPQCYESHIAYAGGVAHWVDQDKLWKATKHGDSSHRYFPKEQQAREYLTEGQ
jgi:hypothetical protein